MIETNGDIHQGEIYWVNVDRPYGSEPGYPRPVVVIQNNVLNQSRINTVAVCALTTNLRRGLIPGCVLLNEGEGHLARRSVVNVTHILTVDRSRFADRIGILSPRRVRDIIDGIYLIVEPRQPTAPTA